MNKVNLSLLTFKINFSGNGDGLVGSLNSKQAKCSMLFAVHTVKKEQREFDITYGKEGMRKINFVLPT